jgi:predicted phage terminase large subunit-like protein
LTPLRYKNTKGFSCTILRKNFNQIFVQGGLWDESVEVYSKIPGASMRKGDAAWEFRGKDGITAAKVNFAHIERKEEVGKFQGSQICAIFFDELTHFDKDVFFYMLSRNRSTCGIKPFMRATCNPDADSWVADFISWWINPETGYAIPERSGKKRWFIRRGDEITWADKKSELIETFNLKTPEELVEPKSVTFIASTIYDNKELLRTNPQYLGNLKALATVERERLLYGNWKIKPSAGMYFKRAQIGDFLQVIPDDVVQWVRCWDLAATEKNENGDAAYTAGVLMGKRKNGRYVVADVINRQMSASDVRSIIKQTAQQDIARFKRVRIRLPQDPGQAGKEQAQSYIKFLSGFDATTVSESGSKESRAEPMAAQWQAGNFDIVIAPWNDPYISQLENFPEGKYKDMVDASANAFTEIELRTQFNIRNLL